MKGIEVITGCMFSGKTTELISRLKNINADYLLIKPQIDNRGSDNKVSTHSGVAENAIKVNNLSDVLNLIEGVGVIGIDEAQFFNESIIHDLNYIKSKGLRIIIAGLEKDYLNKPFKSMLDILSIADSVTRLTAICNKCGRDATCSYRKNTNSKKQLLIGDANFYEARCEQCFNGNQP